MRPLEASRYEVVIGAHRLKAARLAEIESVPVRVKQMTGAEAIEAQVVELSGVRKCFLRQIAGHHVVYVDDVVALRFWLNSAFLAGSGWATIPQSQLNLRLTIEPQVSFNP